MSSAAIADVISRLTCPVDGSRLEPPAGFVPTGVPWPAGQFRSHTGRRYPITGGILRVTERGEDYARSFGLQWRRYARTQLDSYTGVPYSRHRLERCLGVSLDALRDKRVLEVGSGAGRFTECLLAANAHVVSMDLSGAVESNVRNCGGGVPYLLLQGDINRSPLPKGYFDYVICLGVIQHTPSPERTIVSLAEHLRPGGWLVIDHYAFGATRFSHYLSLHYPLRELLRRAPPDIALRAVIALTAVCDPIRRRTCRYPTVDRVAARFLPTCCYYQHYPELAPNVVYEWNELDTFDMLTDHHKHRRGPAEIEQALRAAGLVEVACSLGGNGVEARARRPAHD